MITLMKKKRLVRLMILCSISLLILAGCGKHEKEPVASLKQLERAGIKIAVALDSPQESSLAQDYPKAELIPYADMFLAYKDVASGKIDACVHARKEMELAIQNGTGGVRLLEENYASDIIAVGISPVSDIPDLKEKLNAFIAEKKADGTLDDMYDRWVVLEDDSMPDITQAENPSFTLCVGTTGTVMPYSYYKGAELAGYDIELAHRFAAWLGAGLEFKVYDFGGIVPAAQAGNIDCIMSNLFYTPEKDESIPFSDPLFEVEITAMVRDTTQSAQSATTAAYTSVDQLNGRTIGSATGTTYDEIVRRRLPDVTFSYYNTYSDMVAAMRSGKIAAFACDEPVLRTIMAENSQVTMMPEYLDTFEFGFIFPKDEKGSALCEQMSEFIREMRESGELSRLEDKWVNGRPDDADMPDAEDLGGENGILTLAINALNAPFDFMRGNQYAGYEVELVVRFCQRYGYGLIIKNMDFDAVLASVQTDKADFGAATISITEERKQSVLFSEPHFSGGTVLAVLKVQEGAASAAGAASKTPQYQSFSDLSRKRVSMLTGAPFEELIRSRVPDVGEFSYYSTMADMLQALRSEKTDAILLNNAVSQLAVNRNPDFAQFPQSLQDSVFGMAFAKGDPRRDTWQAAFDSIPKETIQAAWEKWTGADERLKALPEQDWPGRNGTVQVAACDTLEPMSYAGEGGELRGFDPELVLMMARELDVHVELVGMELSAVLSYVQSGKALIGVGSIIATDERRESVDFIDYHPAAFVLVVRAAGESAERTSFLDGVKSSFYKTFIRENRRQLFVKGVVTTLVITLFSILFGTLLGFGVFMLCRDGNPAANLITRFCMWLIQGTDCSIDFFFWCMKRHPRLWVTYFPKTIKNLVLRKMGKMTEATMQREFFGYLTLVDDFDEQIERYWDRNEKRIAPWYLQQKRPDDLIISASPNCIIEPIARRLGVRFMATDFDREFGVFLNKMKYAKEKARYIIDQGFPMIENFYSDSLADTPLALLAEKAHLVTNKASTVIDWPDLDEETMKKVRKKIDTGWNSYVKED